MTYRPMIIPNIDDASSEAVAADLGFVEKRYEIALPRDYASFMRTYNGGHVHPCHFPHRHPMVLDRFGEENSALQYLYSAADLREKAGFAFDKVSWPPRMLPIGTVNGGDDVLLSLEQASFGQVFYWLRFLDVDWGEGENNVLPLIAESFTTFLGGLFVDEDLGDPPPWNRIEKQGDRRIVPLAL